MRLSTFDREDPNPFLTTPADRTATPWNRRATTYASSKTPIKPATSLVFWKLPKNEPVWKGCARRRGFPQVSALAPATREIPLPPRPNSGRSRALRIPPALRGGEIRLRDRFWGVGSPPPRPPAASSKNKDFWRPWGRLSGGRPSQSASSPLGAIALFGMQPERSGNEPES